jgi:alpha-tubulin suppressor-like RCC1 family protein
VGGTHSVALVGSDTLAFWGDNASGQFGTTKTGTVTTLTPGGIISAVTAGEGFTCYLSSGTVYCAGRNDLGQLGRGTVGGTGVTFLPVLNVPAATALSAGGKGGSVGGVTSPRGRYATLGSACARTGSGQVYCWGDDSQGQLGRGLSAGPSGDPALVELEPTDPLP